MSKLRSLARKLDPATYSNWKTVAFNMSGTPAAVHLPVPAMLLQELEQVLELVNDPVLRAYVPPLASLIAE